VANLREEFMKWSKHIFEFLISVFYMDDKSSSNLDYKHIFVHCEKVDAKDGSIQVLILRDCRSPPPGKD
jgi:hypothetical protein